MSPPAKKNRLERLTTVTSRAREYFQPDTLQTQTGQPPSKFPAVVVKELMDNALDAAESAGVAPEIVFDVTEGKDKHVITVADNGGGIPAEKVAHLLNFDVLMSDKSAYVSPTRGQQGNGLKTIIGIPTALRRREPVVIETQSRRYTITPRIDPAGVVHIDTQQERVLRRPPGTRITVTLPAAGQNLNPEYWRAGFALFNPHATIREHAQSGNAEPPEFYTPSVPPTWRKPVPTDPTSPHWYTEADLARLVTAHDNGFQRGEGLDLPLTRGFLQTFDGLKSSIKAKEVRDLLTFEAERLSDLAGHEDRISELLKAMKMVAQVPPPARMGKIPSDHYRDCFDQWYGLVTPEAFWHKRVQMLIDGVPWVADVALASTEEPGDVFYGVNYSLVPADPVSGDTPFVHKTIARRGLSSFLQELDVFEPGRAAAIHIITPTAPFLNGGKTDLALPKVFAAELAQKMGLAGQTLHHDKKRRERNPSRSPVSPYGKTPPLTQVLFVEPANGDSSKRPNIIEIGFAVASGPDNLPVPAHSLFYQVRPLVEQWYLERGYEPKEFDSQYFEQNLLVKYQQKFGDIPGLIREPREELMEPHPGGREVPIGTLEVEEYEFPDYRYHSLLYVEKRGLKAIWKSVRLGERFDLAIINGGGEPSEAVRKLLERAESLDDLRDRLAVLHDCDLPGYIIAHTTAEETERMLGYHVDVIDLGLKVADAIELGLPQESYTRKVALPKWVVPAPGYLDRDDEDWEEDWQGLPGDWKEVDDDVHLSRDETRWFVGKYAGQDKDDKPQWRCIRVELNAMPVPDLVAFVEGKLAEHGMGEKLRPPQDVMTDEAEKAHGEITTERMYEALKPILDDVAETMRSETAEADLALDGGPAEWIEDAYGEDRSISWREAIRQRLMDTVEQADEQRRPRSVELLREKLGREDDTP